MSNVYIIKEVFVFLMNKKIFFLTMMMLVVFTSCLPFSLALDEKDFFQGEADVSQKISEFTQGRQILIVVGEDVSSTEFLALKFFESTYDEYEISSVHEKDFNGSFDGVLLLIGGTDRNEFTKKVLENDPITEVVDLKAGELIFVSDDEGNRYLVFSDKVSDLYLANTAKKTSPLNKVVPEEYVPLTASVFGIILLFLWNFLTPVVVKTAKFLVSDKILRRVKKKKYRDEFRGFGVFGLQIKYRELLSILFSAVVFAAAFSYTKFVKDNFLEVILVGLLVNIAIFYFKYFVRLVLDKRNDVRSEFVFYKVGALITLITGWLGNAFSLTGYTVSKNKKEELLEGKIQYQINLATFLLSIIFFIIALFEQNIFLKMAYSYAVSFSFLQLLPIKPYAGKYMLRWNKTAWILLFIPMLVAYVFINLI